MRYTGEEVSVTLIIRTKNLSAKLVIWEDIWMKIAKEKFNFWRNQVLKKIEEYACRAQALSGVLNNNNLKY